MIRPTSDSRRPSSLWLYRCALAIYPLRLRLQYREQMLQTLCDAYREHQGGKLSFWVQAYCELIQSSIWERFYMVRDVAFQRPLILHTVILAAILTLLGGAAALITDQMLRRGADQPQIDMSAWYAGEIAAGEAPDNAIPPGYVDLERSLQPVIIFYDEQGRPVQGTGYLDQKLPAPPPGVFDFVRHNGYEKVTWQPQSGVRLASIIRRVNGAHPGFILAARSLRVVEEQKLVLWRMALGFWIVVMLLVFGSASMLRRVQRRAQIAA
jgi:hypothetical protein